ncbi:hypothetical protein H0H93_013038 [Arthromyces matolae]|nr:hypothetical protein H0H93_013038 [Arthromyces matolae]
MNPFSNWIQSSGMYPSSEQIAFTIASAQDSRPLLSHTLSIPSIVGAISAGALIIQLFLNSHIYERISGRFLSEGRINDEEPDASSRPRGIRGHIESLGGNVIFTYKIARLVGCLLLTGLSLYGFLHERGSRSAFEFKENIDLSIVASYNPMEVPNPEQTASLLSLAVYSFLDPIVFLAYKIPHLSHEQLPPLSDSDYAKTLKANSFPHIDPFAGGRKQHLAWGLLRTFWREYIILAVMIFISACASFASPVGVKELLRYIETRGENASIRPWFWILWLFAGPVLGSLAWQWYIYINTRTLVRAEGIITQLIFEHSLRIRVKAETEQVVSPGPSTPTGSDTNSVLSVVSPDEADGTTAHSSDFTGSMEGETLHSQDDTLHTSSSSLKSDSSKKPEAKNVKPADGSASENEKNLVGKINNLVTTDLGNITDSRDFLMVLIYTPLQIIFCIIFLYLVLGWSAFVGLATMILLFPIPGYVAKRIQDVQVIRLKQTDARVQTVTESMSSGSYDLQGLMKLKAMNVLRMIKLFGWEKKMEEKVAEKRDKELVWIWRRQILDLINGNLNSMAVFDMLREQLHMVFYSVSRLVTGKVSIDRVNDFLKNTELLDSFSEKEDNNLLLYSDRLTEEIGFRDASFTWSNDAEGNSTPSKRNFMLKIDGELEFQRGQINLIIGPTGSGKTSLLMALLERLMLRAGEMHFIPSHPHSKFHLPRDKGVAYAAQESWVQNETIKENILFGSPFDEERYKKVLYQCALERDLTLFEAGDKTEVGEKGLTLSGGQKARLTLARAVYSRAEILLLDDVLAALDVHTAKWIVEKCFAGDLLKGRTVLLVTHNVAMARPIASYVVSMAIDGTIHTRGAISEALSDSYIAEELAKDEDAIAKVESDIDSAAVNGEAKADGKLIVAEEIELGHVSWAALKLYFAGLGGNSPVFFFLAVITGLILCDLSNVVQTWFLGYWASQYDPHHPSSEVPVLYYIGIYSAMLLAGVALYCASYLLYIHGVIRASRSIHSQLLSSVLGTTLRWLDVTPTSRVIARCTQDIRAVDGDISNALWWLSEMTFSMMVKFGAIMLFTPAFILPGVAVAILGGWTGQVYIAAQLSVKREMSNAKAPVLGHFGAAIAGLASIRAYGAQKVFQDESLNRINRYTRAARTFYNLNRWICVRVDAIGGLFAASLATYLVYFQDQKASNTGFSLNMAVGFSGMILWWVRVLNDFEVQGNSLERIQGYIQIEQEPKASQQGVPPAYWPSSGEIQAENLSAKYSSDGPTVLHNLSFHIKSGERVGVVGRTGSGKSSLTLSLLRCIYNDGNVYYDGLNTKDINLDVLRSNITIIPQIPELLSGSLRQNLDPFEQYDDATLNDALRAAGLFSLQNEMEEGRITLDSAIASGGINLSVGQRQILALARAIVRGSKLLILDEATSAIDYKTDSIIQTSLRKELRGDVTLITIAHRLQTIMDADKIMVLDAGRIVEFDSPKELLKVAGGKLKALVDESGDKDALYAMAQRE